MQGQTNRKIIRGRLQRKLRNEATDAERRLWQYLRDRQLNDCKFRRQHPYGNFILDFACLERRIAIELDGGQHAETALADAERTRVLGDAGWKVIRFWNNEVFDNTEGVVEVIIAALQAHAPEPSPPHPPLEGEG
ncbi:endonuclease domain-containing protein [Luteimonas kalidii]|uniref:Endonuclease domain-containing protein n=1 Tax=Luteimonas kalidii TaxID=3042025 RepID=A0ABT6JUP9_9GAMM|nr:endonuclease domain-containing protein [Luteimonas kalidii]MDH5834207.1 endonuclease domain-containing protein [Luteimonas kalidii]